MSGQSWGFASDSLEYVIDDWVHDAHRFTWDSGVWVDLFQYFVDVDRVRLLSLLLSLFTFTFCSFGGIHCLLDSFWSCWFFLLGPFVCLNFFLKLIFNSRTSFTNIYNQKFGQPKISIQMRFLYFIFEQNWIIPYSEPYNGISKSIILYNNVLNFSIFFNNSVFVSIRFKCLLTS